MEHEKEIRTVLYTDEFNKYLQSLDERAKAKFADCFDVLKTVYVLSTKFVKKLVDTDMPLYELRVSVGYNEYRSILFSTNHENIIQATEVIILNGFLKKSTKDYDKQIKRAKTILNNLQQ